MGEEVESQEKPQAVKRSKEKSKSEVVAETVLALVTSTTNKIAAERLGLSEDGLYKRLRTIPEIREEIAKMPDEALARLQASSVRASEVLVESLGERANKLAAATQLLDRVGVKGAAPALAVQINNYGNLTDDQLDQLIEARKNRVAEAFGGEGTQDPKQSLEVRETTPEAEGSNTGGAGSEDTVLG